MNININTNAKHKQTYLLSIFPWILSFNFTLYDINYKGFCYANPQMHPPPHPSSGNLQLCRLPPSHPATCVPTVLHFPVNPGIAWIWKYNKWFMVYLPSFTFSNLPNILKVSNRIHIFSLAQYLISPNCRSNSRLSPAKNSWTCIYYTTSLKTQRCPGYSLLFLPFTRAWSKTKLRISKPSSDHSMGLLSSLIKLWDKTVQRVLSYDRTNKHPNKLIIQLYIYPYVYNDIYRTNKMVRVIKGKT